jgi:hypothetical protein
MRFQTTSRPLGELVSEFHNGSILLPQFQRDFVWRPAKIRNLLDSLLRGYPIGGFYLWRPSSGTKDAKAKAIGEQQIGAIFEGYLIDGQQRLTSLEAAYALYSGEDRFGAELRCFLDLAAQDGDRRRDTRLFVTYGQNRRIARRVELGDPSLVAVSSLLHGPDYTLRREAEETLRVVPGWNVKRVSEAMTRLDRAFEMLTQQVPCTTISDVSDNEAVEVFSRLNKGGSALRQGDVRAAELARGSAVEVLKRMREFARGERQQRLGFGFSFAFRALVLFHREAAQFSTLKPDWMETGGPNGRSLAKSWDATAKAIEESLTFVDEHMGWCRRALLPSANAVIVLAAALDRANLKISSDDEVAYRQWLCLTALRGVFQGSVETTMNRFHRAIREFNTTPARALLDALKRDEARRVHPEEVNTYAQLWGPATQVIHAWLVSRDAEDWVNGESLDALARSGSVTLPGGDLTVHHIFPRRLLAELGAHPDDANCPANYALLSRDTNSEFGSRRPDEVFAGLPADARARAGVQFFGEDAGDRLNPERYEEFCEWRAKRLADAINQWVGL